MEAEGDVRCMVHPTLSFTFLDNHAAGYEIRAKKPAAESRGELTGFGGLSTLINFTPICFLHLQPTGVD